MAGLSEWRTFPRAPGVYLMSDARGKVLYVGKAKELRARLQNYTAAGGDGRPQIPHLIRRVSGVRCIVTATEKEALLLENTLIKEHRPPFNVFLRDDKEYLLLRIDRTEEFPRPELVRRVARDGAAYFGPYSSARGIRETPRLLFRLFPCSCSRRSSLPGAGRVSITRSGGAAAHARGDLPEEYLLVVDNAIRFRKGLSGPREALERGDGALAREMKFEEVGRIRDRIATLKGTLVRQRVVRAVQGDVDAVGWHREGPEATGAVLHVRSGRLSDAHSYAFRVEGAEDEALSSFLLQHYSEGAYFPGEILLPMEIADREPLASLLSDRAGNRVRIKVPAAGGRVRLVALADTNAAEAHRMRKEKEAAYERLSARLASLCHLPKPPLRIEGFDISNLSGTEPVGSMVAFVGGKAVKKWYRKFTVRGVEGQDDFAMMEQVVRRRFGHDEDFGGMPDLVLIDGGKGQLSKAMEAMKAAGVDFPVIALPRRGGGATVFRERIFAGRKRWFFPERSRAVPAGAGAGRGVPVRPSSIAPAGGRRRSRPSEAPDICRTLRLPGEMRAVPDGFFA
jgi:excinuclease ABC subunit C